MQIENAWYRISPKALIYNEKGQILLCKENDGYHDFPGGGLDHGEEPRVGLIREIYEELGLKVVSISERPIYFLTAHKPLSKTRPWIANIFYEVEVEDYDFTPSDECREIGFYDAESVKEIEVLPNVEKFFRDFG